jgi:hypothetical protein
LESISAVPPKKKSISSLTFFGEPMKAKDFVTYLGAELYVPPSDKQLWSLSLHLKDVANSIKQKSAVFQHLRCPRFKLDQITIR